MSSHCYSDTRYMKGLTGPLDAYDLEMRLDSNDKELYLNHRNFDSKRLMASLIDCAVSSQTSPEVFAEEIQKLVSLKCRLEERRMYKTERFGEDFIEKAHAIKKRLEKKYNIKTMDDNFIRNADYDERTDCWHSLLEPDVLTHSRLLLIFPHFYPLPYELNFSCGCIIPKNIQAVCMQPGFGGLIPLSEKILNNDAKRAIITVHLFCMKLMTSSTSLRTNCAVLQKRMVISLVSDDRRLRSLQNSGFITECGKLTQTMINALKKIKEKEEDFEEGIFWGLLGLDTAKGIKKKFVSPNLEVAQYQLDESYMQSLNGLLERNSLECPLDAENRYLFLEYYNFDPQKFLALVIERASSQNISPEQLIGKIRDQLLKVSVDLGFWQSMFDLPNEKYPPFFDHCLFVNEVQAETEANKVTPSAVTHRRLTLLFPHFCCIDVLSGDYHGGTLKKEGKKPKKDSKTLKEDDSEKLKKDVEKLKKMVNKLVSDGKKNDYDGDNYDYENDNYDYDDVYDANDINYADVYVDDNDDDDWSPDIPPSFQSPEFGGLIPLRGAISEHTRKAIITVHLYFMHFVRGEKQTPLRTRCVWLKQHIETSLASNERRIRLLQVYGVLNEQKAISLSTEKALQEIRRKEEDFEERIFWSFLQTSDQDFKSLIKEDFFESSLPFAYRSFADSFMKLVVSTPIDASNAKELLSPRVNVTDCLFDRKKFMAQLIERASLQNTPPKRFFQEMEELVDLEESQINETMSDARADGICYANSWQKRLIPLEKKYHISANFNPNGYERIPDTGPDSITSFRLACMFPHFCKLNDVLYLPPNYRFNDKIPKSIPILFRRIEFGGLIPKAGDFYNYERRAIITVHLFCLSLDYDDLPLRLHCAALKRRIEDSLVSNDRRLRFLQNSSLITEHDALTLTMKKGLEEIKNKEEFFEARILWNLLD